MQSTTANSKNVNVCYHTKRTLQLYKNWALFFHSKSYHRLNGSSSPVLTATSLSYGKAKN